MTKIEFLNELRNKLKGLPKDDLENRLSFYEEMINDRMDDGVSEEEAVAAIGTVGEVVNDIAKDIPLTTLVKERVKPNRSLKAWEIVLIILGFPLWFPLALTALILAFVAYLLIWILVIVTYAVELSLVAGSIGMLVVFMANLINGSFSALYLGGAILAAGGAVLFFFACVGATKLTIKLSQTIFTNIKSSIIKKGRNEK